ncbi:MAG: UDP-3-O-(3-hydroxymyristoyl)glucosamine N-acyltransferase [Candidatus Amoebophilus sp. 36-38]|nr:MAG: UDP-3-O-(3-hydroxymyristoyl)glucosamine N-acyltransferase [Candidatus Amoebophilus sp. 36-38]
MVFTINEIAHLLEGKVVGDDSLKIDKLCKIQEAVPGSITFLANPSYEKYLYTTQASVIIINKNFQPARPISASLILVEDPYLSFTKLLTKYESLLNVSKKGIEEPTYLGKNTTIGDAVYRGAFSYIGDHVQLGNGVQIYPHAYIGDHVSIGENTIIYSGVRIYPGSRIGKNCIIHAGAVIGSDGFGFVPEPTGSYQKTPQLGYVVIEDHVEIGANTTIERATLGNTWIKQGTKIGNLVEIAHNVEIGRNTIIVALSGIAGSAKIGNHCMIGGQVGVAGHTEMGDKTMVAGQAGVTKSYKNGNITLMGTPAFERKKYLKNYALFKQLQDIQKTLKN